MNEKGLSVLDKYDLKIKATKRVRGSYYCDTDRGLMLLSECETGKSRLEMMEKVLQKLEENKVKTDLPIRNSDGELISLGADGGEYILRKWYDNRECNVEDCDDILECTRQLARVHLVAENMSEVVAEENVICPGHIKDTYAKHTRELLKTKSFIRKMKRRTAFEECLENEIDMYLEQALEADSILKNIDYHSMLKETMRKKTISHGNSRYHNFLITSTGAVLVNYNKINNGPQIRDVYSFLKKVMEKNEFDINMSDKILEEYNKIKTITNKEMELLNVMFLYPEKFWKVVNNYINSKKDWVSEKNREKLLQIKQQEVYRKRYIDKLKGV